MSKPAAALVLLLLVLRVAAQQPRPAIDWDLTYVSVLERNKVARTEWIWSWLAQYKTPAEKWVTGWNGDPIVSSVLIEHPAFHAAEHTTMWLLRTRDKAFYWESIAGSKNIGYEEPVPPHVYDAFYAKASTWKQFPPKPASVLKDGAFPGYMGFLSLYGTGGVRQLLLTFDDFSICIDKRCTPGKTGKSGRLLEALMPILIPESKRNYKHRSEAEIAAMTPEQRIDEEIKEQHHFSNRVADRQDALIRKYRRRDGLKASSHIIKLIESYDPKRLRDNTYDAVAIAMDIDDRSVRLRGTPEGRKVIEAIERLTARMKAAGEPHTPEEMDLPKLKGLNFVDHAIGDTLRVRYRIKLSESELLRFVNFLIERDPAYPTWSEQEFIRDQSQINEAGSPAQFHIMKEPARFHREYVIFKTGAADGTKAGAAKPDPMR